MGRQMASQVDTHARAGEVGFRYAGHLALLIPLLMIHATGCVGNQTEEIEESRSAALVTGAGIDRVLGFETPSADWSVLWSASGTITSSSVASQGTSSLALQPRNYVPIQSAELGSLGSRTGTALQLDVRFEGVQSNPSWWGTIQAAISIPSLGIDAGSNGSLAPFELTRNLVAGWNTLTFPIPADLQAKLASPYSSLQIRITFNVPNDLTGTYLIDNLRFLGGSTPGPDAGSDIGSPADAGGSTPPPDAAADANAPVDAVAGPPPIPTGLSAKAQDGQAMLTWNQSKGATSYLLGRSLTQGGPYYVFTTTNVAYLDTVVDGVTFYYVVAARGPHGDSAYSPEITVMSLPPASRTVKISLKFPKGVSRDSVVFGANGMLKINDRNTITDSLGNPMAVSNAGGDSTELGVEATSGKIVSVSKVILRNKAIVNGPITTGDKVYRQDGTSVRGAVAERVSLAPTEEFSWSIQMPAKSNAGDITVRDGSLENPWPGSYGNVTVNPGGKLQLKWGVYHMDSLDLEPHSELQIDKTYGPVVIYVKDSAKLRGKLVDLGGPPGNFLLVYLSPSDLFVEQAFTGTIVAPNTRISLASIYSAPFRGAFYAQDIESHQDNTIMALPFDWNLEHGNCRWQGCSAPEQCNLVGVCNSQTGVCSKPPVPDGKACDDHSLCTQNDTCQAGICKGTGAISCPSPDACHVGTCEPSTGACQTPNAPNWSTCDDGEASTHGETCQAGQCLWADTWIAKARTHDGIIIQWLPVKAFDSAGNEIGSGFTEADGTVTFGFPHGTDVHFIAYSGGGEADSSSCTVTGPPVPGYPLQHECSISVGIPVRIKVSEDAKRYEQRTAASGGTYWELVSPPPVPVKDAPVYLHQINNKQDSGPIGRPAFTDSSGHAVLLVPSTGTYRFSAAPDSTTTTQWYSEHPCLEGVCDCNQSVCTVSDSAGDCKSGDIIIARFAANDPLTTRGATYPTATWAHLNDPVGNHFMREMAETLMTLASHSDPTNYNQIMRTAFGNDIPQARLDTLRSELASGNLSHALPPVQFVEHDILKDHMGAYAKSTGTVYMSTAATSERAQSLVYGIEMGHHIAVYLRQGLSKEAPGAEGDVFHLLATGVPLSQDGLTHLTERDDHGTITLRDGTSLSVRFGFWSRLAHAASFVYKGISYIGDQAYNVASTIYYKGAVPLSNFAYSETIGVGEKVWNTAQSIGDKVFSRINTWAHEGVLYQVNAWSSRLTLGLVSVDQVWMGYNVLKGTVGSGFSAMDKLGTAIKKIESGDIEGGLTDAVVAAAELSAEEVVGNLSTITTHEVNILDQMFFAPQPRGLTSEEMKVLTPVFCGSIDYDAVLIKTDCGVVWDLVNKIPGRKGEDGYGRAMSVDNTINLMGQPDPDHYTLVHEMAHVWQYQHAGPLYKGESIVSQINQGAGSYDWEGALDAGAIWSTLGCEKQAAFVEAAFRDEFWPNKSRFRFNSKDYTQKAIDMANSLSRGAGAHSHL